ncbi:MAG: AEC family transporter [Deltaproteobacteria bacterium]|nr:AEC family transporter [Deltaproteobacteria bacterium]MBW1875059.1 AEC family transporter [Deltaproteobacteria bacterium]MBW2212032.1 AEC family transporter [Deltaproteobacteria bacterium]MBW2626575.1 AEC family transporter [Deltaproteobacteria bacterium]MBW2685585.1 AEC family transporter [Deltaproteobacteria bacterium]
MILELLSVVAPVFVVALVGLAWARSGTHFDEVSISRLVLNVGIPCLVFRSLTSLDVPPAELARMAGLAASVMSMFAVGGFAVLKVMNLPAHTYLGPLVFANSGNIGLPICLFAFGDAGLALGMAYFAVSSTCHVVLGGPLFAGSFSLRPFFRSPLTWAVILTVGVVASGVSVPTWIARTTTLLGDIAIPLMLLTLGVSLSKMHPESLGRSLILSFVRLALGLSAGLLLTTLLGVEGLTRKVLVLQASMPVGVLNYLFAQRYARSPEQVASLVLVSTLVSVVSIPMLLAWL